MKEPIYFQHVLGKSGFGSSSERQIKTKITNKTADITPNKSAKILEIYIYMRLVCVSNVVGKNIAAASIQIQKHKIQTRNVYKENHSLMVTTSGSSIFE